MTSGGDGTASWADAAAVSDPLKVNVSDTAAMLAGYKTAINASTNANTVGWTLVADPARLAAPGNATSYYYTTMTGAPTSVVNTNRIVLPFNCTLIGYSLAVRSSVTASAETSTIAVRVNNTTDFVINTTAEFSGSGMNRTYYSNSLNQNYSAGDLIEIKWTTPTWTTPPTNAGLHTVLYFKFR
jgi:hypothetical protein